MRAHEWGRVLVPQYHATTWVEVVVAEMGVAGARRRSVCVPGWAGLAADRAVLWQADVVAVQRTDAAQHKAQARLLGLGTAPP
ncbi:MAG: hypothetical protein AAFP97_12905 [Pseudomonadota bacterium]